MDPETWAYLPHSDPQRIIDDFQRAFDEHRPRLVVFGAPDNPTSQVLPQALVDAMRARTADDGAWLAIDFAYKCQYFEPPPAYYAWSPAEHPQRDRHPLEFEVGTRTGPTSRMARRGAGRRRRRSSASSSAACSAPTRSRSRR